MVSTNCLITRLGRLSDHPSNRDTWDKPEAERRFLFKLDACLLTYAALSYFSK